MNQTKYLKILNKFISKHHALMYIVIVALLLSSIIFSLNQSITQVLDEPLEPPDSSVTFDEETEKKIEKLHDSSEDLDEITLPSPRPSPFKE